MSIIKPDDLKAAAIAAWRYYAFLEVEKRFLRHELLPGWKPVDQMVCATSPLERAEKVLRFLDINPHEYDAWVDSMGIDAESLPTLGSIRAASVSKGAGEGLSYDPRPKGSRQPEGSAT